MDTQVIAKAETALRDAAREHTKLSFAHRKAAERLHRVADEIKRALGPLGISVEIGTDGSQSRE